MALGLRALARMRADDPARALYLMQLNTRLDELTIDLGLDAGVDDAPRELGRWTRETRQCLKASAAPAGS
jgi:hypothetical protein